ncbi:MAG: enoyl-CoA hydratase/isomerase family protein [Deltaproteobacteria bacterium]|nr:enoyl-CoA hydratase/isomerase family protein [Deltaproteobacteria bacterium]
MSYEDILYEKKDAVAKITLNRPEKLNAITGVMFKEIIQALDDAEQDDVIRVVVLTGKGRAFCTGVDLKFAGKELDNLKSEWDFLRIGKKLLGKIEDLSKPVIAVVNGLALAGGFEIILAADIIIASEDAKLGDQHMKVGMFGAGGSPYRLALSVGLKKAKELVLTGKWVSGKEAEKIGLVNKAVPAEDLEKAVDEMVADLVDLSPVAMRITKSYMNRVSMHDADSKIEMAMLSAMLGNRSEDHEESMRAFNEKRKPQFKGR